MAIGLISQEDIEKILSPNQLKVWKFLQEVGEVTPGEISEKTGVVRSTVSQALVRLVDLRKVERIGLGATTRYKKM